MLRESNIQVMLKLLAVSLRVRVIGRRGAAESVCISAKRYSRINVTFESWEGEESEARSGEADMSKFIIELQILNWKSCSWLNTAMTEILLAQRISRLTKHCQDRNVTRTTHLGDLAVWAFAWSPGSPEAGCNTIFCPTTASGRAGPWLSLHCTVAVHRLDHKFTSLPESWQKMGYKLNQIRL